MGQVRSDVDQFAAQEPPPRCDIFILHRTRAARGFARESRMFRFGKCHIHGAARSLPRRRSAQEGGDLQAQILYAYQAEDTNQLANLVQTLTNQVKSGGADAALRYHLAHAQYRFGLLAGDGEAPMRRRRPLRTASSSSSRCSSKMSNRWRRSALQSACYAQAREIPAPGGGAVAIARRGAAADRAGARAAQSARAVLERHGGLRPFEARRARRTKRAFEQLQIAAQALRSVLGHPHRCAGLGTR